MDKIYRMANRGGSRRHEATKENPHFAIHNPKFGQNEQNYQNVSAPDLYSDITFSTFFWALVGFLAAMACAEALLTVYVC
jgi:hypothetical protein